LERGGVNGGHGYFGKLGAWSRLWDYVVLGERAGAGGGGGEGKLAEIVLTGVLCGGDPPPNRSVSPNDELARPRNC